MIKVCVVGSPSCRKSTVCEQVNVVLKMAGIKSELVREFARDYIDLNGHLQEPWEQSVIYEGQKKREDAVMASGKEVVLCDSSTFLGIVYLNHLYNKRDFRRTADFYFLKEMYGKYIEGMYDYDLIFYAPPVGENIKDGTRIQTDDERLSISNQITAFMDMHGVKYHVLPSDFESKVDYIFNEIVNCITDEYEFGGKLE